MKHINIFLVTICLFSTIVIAGFSIAKDLAGSWSFNVEQTAPEYSSGTIVFEEAGNEKFAGKIIFSTGREILLQSVTVEADTVTFTTSVDGSLVTTVCTLEGNQLSGSVRTPDGYLPFSAMRKE